MDNVVLEKIIDIFQIEGRGTVVTGPIGGGWNAAKRGDKIELRTPDGRCIQTTIKDREFLAKGKLTPEPIPTCAVLLGDVIASDQLPRDTKILRIPDGQHPCGEPKEIPSPTQL